VLKEKEMRYHGEYRMWQLILGTRDKRYNNEREDRIMSDILTFQGYWKIEGTEKQYYGTLSYENGSLSLVLDYNNNEEQSLPLNIETVHGRTDNDMADITLFQCYKDQKSLRQGGITRIHFAVTLALQGFGFVNRQVLFQRVEFKTSHLLAWLEQGAWRSDIENKCLLFNPPQPIELLQNDIAHVVVDQSTAHVEAVNKTIKLKAPAILQIDYAVPCSIETIFREWVEPIRNFLSLATGHLDSAVDVKVYTDQGVSFYLLHTTDYWTPEDDGILPPQYMFMPLRKIRNDISAILARWLAMPKGDLRRVYRSYFHAFYNNKKLSLQTSLLDALTVLDAYSRRKHGSLNLEVRLHLLLGQLKDIVDYLLPEINDTAIASYIDAQVKIATTTKRIGQSLKSRISLLKIMQNLFGVDSQVIEILRTSSIGEGSGEWSTSFGGFCGEVQKQAQMTRGQSITINDLEAISQSVHKEIIEYMHLILAKRLADTRNDLAHFRLDEGFGLPETLFFPLSQFLFYLNTSLLIEETGVSVNDRTSFLKGSQSFLEDSRFIKAMMPAMLFARA
jgi:ApeA N-terminal domain 1